MEFSDLHCRAIQKLTEKGFKLEQLEEHARFLASLGHGRNSKKVQIKTRIGIYREYWGQDIHLCFPTNRNGNERWFLIPHDKLVEIVGERTPWLDTYSWEVRGIYHSANPSRRLLEGIVDYELK